MAGEWIKMRTNLWDDPRVSRLCDITGQSEAAIVGALFWLWSSADEHSEDGVMPGLSLAGIDRKTSIKGIGAGLVEIGWLADHPEGVRITRFDEHNGASAKKRIQTAKRVAEYKARNQEETPQNEQGNASSVTPTLAMRDLEEEEEEEVSQLPISERSVEVEHSPPAQPAATARAVRGSRLPADWQLPKAWGEWALQEKPGWAADDVRRCADKFRDHWHAATGRTATKADWQATWRNWVRNEQGPPARASPRDIREAEGRRVIEVLTGAGRNEQRSERDITGEVVRLAG